MDPLPGSAWQGPPPPPALTAIAVEDRPERYPFWGWGDVLVFLALVLPCFMAATMMGLAVMHVAGFDESRRNAVLMVSQFAGYGLSFMALWAMFKTRYRRPFWDSLAWRMERWMIVPMFGTGLGLAFAVVLAAALLQTKPVRTPMEELMRDPTTATMVAVFAVTIGPVCEELVFRGLLQPLLIRSLGVAAGIIAGALPFALLHGPQYAWSWQRVVLVAAAGAAFGVVRHRTGSTALAAVAHAGYNLTFFVLYYIAQVT